MMESRNIAFTSTRCSQCSTSNVIHLFFFVLLNAFVWLLEERERLLKRIETLERSSDKQPVSDISWKIKFKRQTVFKTPRSTFHEHLEPIDSPTVVINNGMLLEETSSSPEDTNSILSEPTNFSLEDSTEIRNPRVVDVDEDNAAKRRQYLAVAREIIETEENYIDNIKILQEMFFAPMSNPNNAASKLITQNDFEKLFRNLNEIFSINTEFLKDLKQASELQDSNNQPQKRQTIGQVFLMYSEYFKAYGLYCAGHNAALATLKKLERSKQFTQFCRSVSVQPRCRKLTLEAFLSMPVSRICKYGLLLRELLKSVPSSEVDNSQEMLLKRALEKISAVVSIVNQRNQHLERIQKVISISESMDGLTFQLLDPSRVFFFEGFLSFFDIKAQRIKPVTVFLFNDIILLARRGLRKGRLRYKIHLDFNDCILKDLPDTNVTNAFQLISVKTKVIIILGAETQEQKTQWINLIMERIQAIAHRNKVIAAKTERRNSDANAQPSPEALLNASADEDATEGQTMINKKIQEMLVREGYLEKLHRNSWKKRYFVLRDGILCRYDTRGGKIKGKIDITGKCSVQEHQPEKYNYCFEIKTDHKTLVLKAPSDTCMHEWLNSFLKQKLLADSSVVKTLERLQKERSPQDTSVYTPVPNFQIME